MTKEQRRRRVWLLLLLPALGLVAWLWWGGRNGAGSTRPPTSVRGKVRLAAQPISSGVVTLHSADGRRSSGRIRPDGTFEVAHVPAGRVWVSVRPPGPRGLRHPAAPASPRPQPRFTVPARYHDPRTSGLFLDLTPGSQVRDLDLSP